MTDSGHFCFNLRAFTSSQLSPKGIIIANNMLVSIGYLHYHTGTIQYDNLTVVRMHYASYRGIGLCLNIMVGGHLGIISSRWLSRGLM